MSSPLLVLIQAYMFTRTHPPVLSFLCPWTFRINLLNSFGPSCEAPSLIAVLQGRRVVCSGSPAAGLRAQLLFPWQAQHLVLVSALHWPLPLQAEQLVLLTTLPSCLSGQSLQLVLATALPSCLLLNSVKHSTPPRLPRNTLAAQEPSRTRRRWALYLHCFPVPSVSPCGSAGQAAAP